jgi:Tol biopolymer transport system component
MPKIADVLERESRSVDLEQGDFERLLDRRERKQRNRRIRAGVVGVIVALATAAALARSLTSDPIPANRPEPRPAPVPAGTLAYRLNGDVYTAEPDGSDAIKIADGLSDEDCASTEGLTYGGEGSMWSPDGRYLAYRRSHCSGKAPGTTDEDRGDVVISDAAGNVLAAFPADGWDIGWSPDSSRVAVWDTLFEKVGVYGVDGARQAQLTMPSWWSPSGDHDPAWLPGGTSLMVDNVEVPLDGATPRQLPLPVGAAWTTYSPDGSLVAYGTPGSLTVARPDGSEPREVFGDWGGGLAWSATGDRIAFTTHLRSPTFSSAELRVLDVASGSVTLLTEGERGASLWVIGFSPQGDRILFSRTEDPAAGESSLWSIGVDGSDARLVVAGTMDGEWLSR